MNWKCELTQDDPKSLVSKQQRGCWVGQVLGSKAKLGNLKYRTYPRHLSSNASHTETFPMCGATTGSLLSSCTRRYLRYKGGNRSIHKTQHKARYT